MKDLSSILKKYNIDLRSIDGTLKDSITIIEELYLKLTPEDLKNMMEEIYLEEKNSYIFENERAK